MRGISASCLPLRLAHAAREFFRREKNRDRAVGDLRAIAHFDPAADDLVEFAFVLRVTLAHEPVAGLRVRIALGVGIIHRRDMREMLVLQAVALVVLVAEAAEQFRKRELDSLGLALVPCRGAQVVAAGGRIDRLHLLDADHAGEVVARRFDFRRRRDNRDRSRRARRLMTAGRQSGKSRIDLDEKRADMALLGVQLGGEVADVSGLDFLRLDFGSFERGQGRLAHHRDEMLAFFRPIAGKVGLRSAQYVYRRWFCHRALLLITIVIIRQRI